MSKTEILRIPEYLETIIEASERIYSYVDDMLEVDFLADEKTQDAVIRNFEIVGKAAHNIERYHGEFASNHPQVLWSFMYSLHNQVIVDYFKVDLELLWRTIQSDLPELHEQVRLLIAS